MRWKSSVISSRACSGALRTRLRSLCTQQRCTGVLPQTSESARRRPALPSTMQSNGTLSPRSTRSSRKPFHASFDSPHISSATSCFCPSASTATAASTGTLVTLPALRTRSAIASRYRYATSSSASERFVHASHALLATQTAQARGHLDDRKATVMLPICALQPLERPVLLSPPSISRRDLEGRRVGVPVDQRVKCPLRFLGAAKIVG